MVIFAVKLFDLNSLFNITKHHFVILFIVYLLEAFWDNVSFPDNLSLGYCPVVFMTCMYDTCTG